MSLLTEVSKTVVDATLAFTSAAAAASSPATTSGLASGVLAQPYSQVGGPIAIPDFPPYNYCWGSFDGATTTFAYAVVLPTGAATVHIYANSAAAGAPPAFSFATTLPVVGAVGVTFFAMTQLSSNGLVCVFGSNNHNFGDGIVAVFTRASTSSQAWTQVATVTGAPGSNLGSSVNISADGSVIVAGVYLSNAGVGSTNVYNFNATTGALSLVTTLLGTGAVGAAQQGYYSALSGDGMTVAVGGPGDDANYGAVWMFNNVGGTWAQTGSKLAAYNASKTPQPFIGAVVALSYNGTRMAVTTYSVVAQNSGCIFMYNLVDGAWTQGQTIYPLLSTITTLPSIYFVTLSDDGNVLVFDQNSYNGNEGAVFVYNRQANGLWVQNGDARIATGALFPLPGSGFYLVATSRTGSMFAMVNTTPSAPLAPIAFSIFQ